MEQSESASAEVTPLVGVWIEMICSMPFMLCLLRSLPLWECGLKFFAVLLLRLILLRHSLCGSVD